MHLFVALIVIAVSLTRVLVAAPYVGQQRARYVGSTYVGSRSGGITSLGKNRGTAGPRVMSRGNGRRGGIKRGTAPRGMGMRGYRKGMRKGNGRRSGTKRGMARRGMGMRGYRKGMRKAVVKKKRRNNDASSKAAVKRVKQLCKKMECRKQPRSAIETKKQVTETLVKQFTDKYKGDSVKAKREAKKQVRAVYAAKKAIIKAEGLKGVVNPLDDGLWGGDMVLTKEQSRVIAKNAGKSIKVKLPGKTRRARNALFVEAFPAFKWDKVINYWIVDHFTAPEINQIHNGINNIASQTCLRFQQSYSGYHIRFYRRPGLAGGDGEFEFTRDN